MRRRLFNFAAAVSLLLCVAVCVLWVRSYTVADNVYRNRTVKNPDDSVDAKFMGLAASRGGLSLNITHQHYPASYLKAYGFEYDSGIEVRHLTDTAKTYRRYGPDSGTRGWEWLGFEWRRHVGPGSGHYVSGFAVVVPAWALITVTGAVPASWVVVLLRRRKQRQRIKAGLCPACGYDLRASPDRCPECATLAAEPAAA